MLDRWEHSHAKIEYIAEGDRCAASDSKWS